MALLPFILGVGCIAAGILTLLLQWLHPHANRIRFRWRDLLFRGGRQEDLSSTQVVIEALVGIGIGIAVLVFFA